MDRLTNGTGTRAFEALVYTPYQHVTWHWRTLPPPPPPPGVEFAADDPTRIASFAAAAGDDGEGSNKIWVSATGSGDVKGCTHLFDAEKLAWCKEERADWVLPFYGCAQYVPQLNKLWFGISSREHGCLLCASDLSGASKTQPPALHTALEDTAARAPDGFELVTARAIYLGSGKFCFARFFATPMRISLYEDKEPEQFAVMAGVQVILIPSSHGGKSVAMVERNSQHYVLNDDDIHWVL